MDTLTIKEAMRTHWQATSGVEHRSYLGMSGIGGCPLRLYINLTQAMPVYDEDYRYSQLGRLFEEVMKKGLGAVSVYRPGSEQTLIAPFDSRFQGHTDGETTEGDLLEIKSVREDELNEVLRTGQVRWSKLAQVTAYMKYGGYHRALLAFVCRENLKDAYVLVPYDAALGDWIEARAKMILQALDTQEPPECECGWCLKERRS